MRIPTPRGDVQRREQTLEAALTVFATFGYRRTSMDAVAQASDVSRPGLYFLFSSKPELFRATMRQELDKALGAVRAALAAPGADLGARLVAALDAHLGRYVGTSRNEGVDALGSSCGRSYAACSTMRNGRRAPGSPYVCSRSRR
ncbi:TetR/AcrR family transcriptional regulator [Streptomyces sp. NPDC002935]|uniref:TetR/AcrR family transcriptional regulator n=1 Tax=Streptomyces sp. NPDC002935 TaxID=3154545 RepID=UPI0033A3B20D